MTCTPNISEFQSRYNFDSEYLPRDSHLPLAPSCEQSPGSTDGRLLGLKWISNLWTVKASNLTVPHILGYSNRSSYHGNTPLIGVMTVRNSSFSLFESREDYEVMSGKKQPRRCFFSMRTFSKFVRFTVWWSSIIWPVVWTGRFRAAWELTLVVWQERCLNGDGW